MKHGLRTMLRREGYVFLLMVAVMIAGAVMQDLYLLLVLAGMLAGPVLISWRWVVVTLRGLEFQRNMPQGVCAGDPLTVSLEVTNKRRRIGSWALTVQEKIRRNGQAAIRPSVFFSYVPVGQSRRREYAGRLSWRGRYQLGPLQVSTAFPFGLMQRSITAGRTDTLLVLPRPGRLARRWIMRHQMASDGARQRLRRGHAQGEFYGVREWRQGDRRRWIHWRSSARHAKLVVRQFEQTDNRDLAILVDLWQPAQPSPHHLENVELAVSFAATVATESCRKGGSNLLVATAGADRQYTAGPASAGLLQNVMERLAVVDADHQNQLAELIEHCLGRIGSGTEVVLLSTRKVDLKSQQFAGLRRDATRSALLREIRCLNTSDTAFGEYFQPE